MKLSPFCLILLAMSASLAPTMGQTFTFFADDFESAPAPDINANDPLLNNGMVVGANVFDSANIFIYNYFTFPAPNVTGEGARFCVVTTGEGGTEQGLQVLSVFNDYNNGAAHTAGDLVDANTFVEYFLDADDLGTTVTFVFDAKLGNFDATPLVPAFTPEAEAYLKVLDPLAGFVTVLSDVEDAGAFPVTWGTYTKTIMIPNDPVWVGRLMQAGFRSKTSDFQDSAVFYDNISLTSDKVVSGPIPPRIVATEISEFGGNNFVDVFVETEVGFTYTLLKALTVEGPYGPAESMDGDVIEGTGNVENLFDSVVTSPTPELSAFYRVLRAPTP